MGFRIMYNLLAKWQPPPLSSAPGKNLFGNIMIGASLRDSLRLVKIEQLYMENFITKDKYIVDYIVNRGI